MIKLHTALQSVLALVGVHAGAGCTDEAFWEDRYGMSCKWYAEHDPGCTRFIDTGQRQACNKTCGNCAGSRQPLDPLDTSCSLTDLCSCFQGCSPEVLCPVSDEAQACKIEVVAADSMSGGEVLPLQAGRAWLELRLPAAEEVHGVEVHGDANNYARTFLATWAGASTGAAFSNVDSGQRLPANWEGGQKARVLFSEGPVQASTLRLYPNDIVGEISTAFSASLVLRRCSSQPPGPSTEAGRCLAMKCKAYCYRKLSCDGPWVEFCEQQRVQSGEACDVLCSLALGQHTAMRALRTTLVVLFTSLASLLSDA